MQPDKLCGSVVLGLEAGVQGGHGKGDNQSWGGREGRAIIPEKMVSMTTNARFVALEREQKAKLV